jgi:hypothetical protein
MKIKRPGRDDLGVRIVAQAAFLLLALLSLIVLAALRS